MTGMFKHVFLTGPPGVGKTTLVQKACEALTSSGVAVEGFYTEEVREGGRRVGFDVVSVTGKRGILSRIGGSSGSSAGRREHRVGQYVVDLVSFESLALPLFRNATTTCNHHNLRPAFLNPGSHSFAPSHLPLYPYQAGPGGRAVFVIDEIGKMELFSQAFIRAVRQMLDGSGRPVLGTIPAPKGRPLGLVEEVRGRSDVKLFTVTKENRNHILQDIVAALQESLGQTA